MVRRRITASAGIFALLFCAPLAQAATVQDLIQQLGSSDRDTRREASLSLTTAGAGAKEAIPALLTAVEDPDKQVWANALTALANLGPAAADAAPALLEKLDGRKHPAMRQRDLRQLGFRIAFVLTRIGPAAMPHLLGALKSDDSVMRTVAAHALGDLGPAAKDAVPDLIANLDHREPFVREEVVAALSAIGEPAAKPLTDALQNQNPKIREGAVTVLAAVPSKTATPALLDLLAKEQDASVRAALFPALAKAGADPARCVPAFIEAIKGDNDTLRHSASNALLSLRAGQDAAASALAALLKDPNPKIAERAASLLGRLGNRAKAALPMLIEAIAKKQPAPAAYVDAVVLTGPTAVPEILRAVATEKPEAITKEHWSVLILKSLNGLAVPPLSAALADSKLPVRLTAAAALGEMGVTATDAAPALAKASADPDPRVRATALGALVGIHANPKVTLPRMEAALHDSAPIVRLTALQLIPYLGESGESLSPYALAALKDKDPAVRKWAASSVSNTMPEAVPALVENLSDPSLRPAMLEALGRVGSAAAPAAPKVLALYPAAAKPLRMQILGTIELTGAPSVSPELQAAMKDGDAEIRGAALGAYAHAEKDPKARLATLTAALADQNVAIRKAAADVLGDLAHDARDAAPQLTDMLQRPEDRPFALEALKKIQPRALPALLAALAIQSPDTRIYACERLASLGPEAREAVPALKGLQNDGSEDVRRAANRALKRIEQR